MGAGSPAVVVLHGHRSTRANHGDFCTRLAAAGISALALDLRGHGDSEGVTDAGMPGDVVAALDALHDRGAGPLGIRGSSLGGYLALLASTHPHVRAVAALCPANNLRLLTRYPQYEWARHLPLVDTVVRDTGVARGYWHARGDEIVPWAQTMALHQITPHPKHLHVAMGGDHRSLQHDPQIQDQTVGWLASHLLVSE